MNVPLLVTAAVTAYALGSVSPATIITRRHGVNVRAIGSGNPGATNVGRALGNKAGVLVAVLDVLKGLLPAAGFGAMDHDAGLVAGLFAVLGHITSPLLQGRGGKGVATAFGALLGSHPLWAPIVLAVWLVVLAVSRWVAVASVAACASMVVIALIAGEDLWWAALLAGAVVLRHRRNLQTRT